MHMPYARPAPPYMYAAHHAAHGEQDSEDRLDSESAAARDMYMYIAIVAAWPFTTRRVFTPSRH